LTERLKNRLIKVTKKEKSRGASFPYRGRGIEKLCLSCCQSENYSSNFSIGGKPELVSEKSLCFDKICFARETNLERAIEFPSCGQKL
jgi:hypothetical protein